MATIVSYLSAETTRGLWKPASMNGTDWPSPAASLAMLENQINKILSATGVDVPSLTADNELMHTNNVIRKGNQEEFMGAFGGSEQPQQVQQQRGRSSVTAVTVNLRAMESRAINVRNYRGNLMMSTH